MSMPTVFNGTNHRIDQRVQLFDPIAAGAVSITSAGLISESIAIPALELLNGAYRLTVNGTLSGLAAGGRGLELGLAAFATPLQVSTITVGAAGEITGTALGIAAFHATNITNNGLIQGAGGIYASGGDVAFSISNAGDIVASTGNAAIWVDGFGTHTITNDGMVIGRIEGSYTSDSVEIITNTGTVDGQIWARGGNDSITNSGVIGDHIYLDGGDDTVVNSGMIDGDIYGFSGNDTVTNTGTVTGWIMLGEGNDVVNGSASAENVADEAGRDIYLLGDGIDNFDAVGVGSAIGNDTINGGLHSGVDPAAGIFGDIYNAADALLDVVINLDVAQQTDRVTGLVHAASRATGTETGTDTVRGMETVFTGEGDDVVFGNASGNFVSSGMGDDHLAGGLGHDYLVGGAGADHLTGGNGRDILDGSSDADLDTIHYTALLDSTATRTGRDTLYNFTETDRVHLGDMGVAGLHYVGTQTVFDGVAGALRVVSTAAGWMIQLDVDGNQTADFALEVLDANHANVTDWSDNFILV
jgi:RTX calcium-binding nonapeptide repeat (4 copies)